MAICRKCGTVYSTGMRYCPKCGERGENDGEIFAAPRPRSLSEEAAPQGETKKRSDGFFAVPLPFAVAVVGLLFNPAVRSMLLQGWVALMYVAGPYEETPMAYIHAFNIFWYVVQSAAVAAVLAASMRRYRGSSLLRFASAVLIMLTIGRAISDITEMTKFFVRCL